MDVKEVAPNISEDEEKVLHVYQDLLTDKGFLGDLEDIRGKSKRTLKRYSINHPIIGLDVVPKQAIERLDERFIMFQGQFFDTVEDLVNNKDVLQMAYAEQFPKLYRPDKYLTEDQLRKRFKYFWYFRQFAPPREEDGILSPKIYKRELEKFQEEMRSIRDTGIEVIGGQFLAKVDEIRKQCSGGTPHSSTLRAMNDFFDDFDEVWSGFIGHDLLKQKIEEAKEYMDGTDAEMLRTSDDFRSIVAEKMVEIMTTLNDAEDTRLYRDIDI
jgi:hypothetical protein